MESSDDRAADSGLRQLARQAAGRSYPILEQGFSSLPPVPNFSMDPYLNLALAASSDEHAAAADDDDVPAEKQASSGPC